MKRFCIAVVAFSFCAAFLSAFSPDDIQSYTLENGLHLYVLSDVKTATVRLELNVYAGYSAQSEATAGFFPLYARVLTKTVLAAGKSRTDLVAETGADCVRLVQTVAPLAVEETLSLFAGTLRPFSVSDTVLRAELAAMKAEVTDYASSAAGFINTAIDARVFPESPWKQESGVYPALFTAQTVQSARVTLDSIGADYYTAPNAALFVSGNITQEEALLLAERAFSNVRTALPPVQNAPFAGAVYAGTAGSELPGRRNPAAGDENGSEPASRKYVLSDDAFSGDMTQIVVQYTDFTRDQADVLASALNNDLSVFKALLTGEESLCIRGAEYVNVASAQKRGSSRLIVQSLLEKTKTSPCVQAERFLHIVEDAAYLDDRALSAAVSLFKLSFFQRRDNASSLMELYASFVASTGKPLAGQSSPGQTVAQMLFSRDSDLSRFSAAELRTVLRLQSPAVFVLVNSAVYKKRSAEFKKAGYELVTAKNGSWYTQALYTARLSEKKVAFTPETAPDADAQAKAAAERFINVQRENISSFSLSNAIPVTVKRESSSQTVSLMLTIAGGELLFADKTAGLCTLLTDALSLAMRRAIAAPCDITAETFSSFSRICITGASSDLAEFIRGSSYALIYSDITPAMADGIAYDERTQWRLKTGTTAFQLVCEAVRSAYSAPYSKLFNDKDDKPSAAMDFTRIATSYPTLLDASRYSLLLCGAVIEETALQQLLDASFGVLESKKATASKNKTLAPPRLPKKAKSVKLRHLFLTDISADKAGPRPQVLVPTKDFSDPVLYCLPSPDLAATDTALFNALLYELAFRLQEKTGTASAVQLSVADDDIGFARLIVTNVARLSIVDALYADTVRELKQDIALLAGGEKLPEERASLLTDMENRWLLHTLQATGTTAETAHLMQTGLMRAGDALLYVRHYATVSNATAQDYYIVAQAYLDENAPFKLYSADSKK